MSDAATFRRLAEAKLRDAELLLGAGRWANAYYLAGYAIELGLKTVIAQKFQQGVIPDKKFVLDIYTHDLARLLALSDMQALLTEDMRASPELAQNWTIVLKWSEKSRYLEASEAEAVDLLTAVNHPDAGAFAWIARHW